MRRATPDTTKAPPKMTATVPVPSVVFGYQHLRPLVADLERIAYSPGVGATDGARLLDAARALDLLATGEACLDHPRTTKAAPEGGPTPELFDLLPTEEPDTGEHTRRRRQRRGPHDVAGDAKP